MKDQEYLDIFAADDPVASLTALYTLGSQRDVAPDVRVLDAAMKFFFDPDMDLRHRSIFAVVIHWAYLPSFSKLLELLETEQDELVLGAVVSGVARLGETSSALILDALVALQRIAADEAFASHFRHQAHLEARRMVREFSANDYAKNCLSPERIPIDMAWFDREISRLRN